MVGGNIERFGSEYITDKESSTESLDQTLDHSEVLILFPTWRYQLGRICFFIFLCLLCPVISHYIPWIVLPGKLFEIGGTEIKLFLPIHWLAPCFVLGQIIITAYDSQYIIDSTGVEARVGLVSFNLIQPRLRYEDIRGVEPKQTLVERILGIGTLLVGSAMMADVEIEMKGIPNPRGVQQYINRRRDLARAKDRAGNTK